MYTTATLAVALRRAVPVDAAGGGDRGGGARRRARRRRVPRQGRARRALRAGDARVHVRRRHDHPQHADRRRPGRLPERRADAEDRSVAGVDVLSARARRGARDARDRLRDLPLAPRRRPVRHPRRRRRRGSARRADVSLQDAGVRHVVRPGGRRRRHPRDVRLLRDGRRYVHDHRPAHRRADERARRHAAMGGAGRRRHDHHGAAVRVHRGRSRGRGQGGLRCRADRGHPVHAAGRARDARGAPPAQARSRGASRRCRCDCARRARARRRDRPARAASSLPADCARRFTACARSTAWTSTCAKARSSASSGPTARASRRSSIS